MSLTVFFPALVANVWLFARFPRFLFRAPIVISSLLALVLRQPIENLSETSERQLSDEEYQRGTISLTFCIHPLSANVPELTSCALDLLR